MYVESLYLGIGRQKGHDIHIPGTVGDDTFQAIDARRDVVRKQFTVAVQRVDPDAERELGSAQWVILDGHHGVRRVDERIVDRDIRAAAFGYRLTHNLAAKGRIEVKRELIACDICRGCWNGCGLDGRRGHVAASHHDRDRKQHRYEKEFSHGTPFLISLPKRLVKVIIHF